MTALSGRRRRRPRHRVADAQARPADPGARDLRDPPVDHVRRAVRVRLRRRDPASRRRQLSRVPDARDLHPDARVRVDHDRDRVRRRHDQGHHRPFPLAADGALRRPQRAHLRRRHLHHGHPRRADALRPRRRLARASSVGDFVLAVLLMVFFTYAMAWVGVYLGLVAPTVETVQQLGFLIIFPLTFLSNAFVPTETLPDVAPADRRVEPDQRAHPGDEGAVRQPEPVPERLVPERAPRSSSRCSGRSRSSPCSRRSGCASTARSTARGRRVPSPGYHPPGSWISTSRPSRSSSATPSARSPGSASRPSPRRSTARAASPSSSCGRWRSSACSGFRFPIGTRAPAATPSAMRSRSRS